jgi:hypothetical protein
MKVSLSAWRLGVERDAVPVLAPRGTRVYNFGMEDYGLDMDEVGKVIDSADVLVVRFAILDKRLLIDARTNGQEGPLITVVTKAGSVEERFKSLKKLRPRFPLPEKIMSFMWPRHVDTFRQSGLAQRITSRLVSIGGDEMVDRCKKALDSLAREERAEVVAAISGGEGYQTLWQRGD